MEQFIEIITGLFFLSGTVFIVVSVITYFFPPKKINSFYGYRTNRSMQSQEKWDFAQKYATRQMLIGGVFMILAGVVNFFFDLNIEKGISGLAILLIVVAYIFYTTELKLKKEFTE